MSNPIIIVSYSTLVLIEVAQGFCLQPVKVNLIGSNITDTHNNLNPNVTHLKISDTGIRTLNLTMAVIYPAICSIKVISSPITDIITPDTSQSTSLAIISLIRSGTFHTPPDLGTKLPGQLWSLVLYGLSIAHIPHNHFENYTKLASLTLVYDPIIGLNSARLVGLNRLRYLYIGFIHVKPLPAIHQCLIYLKRLHVPGTGIKVLPSRLLKYLPRLQYLDLKENQLFTVPRREIL